MNSRYILTYYFPNVCRSAQGESFSDEDKYLMSSDKILSCSTQDSFLQNKQDVERKTETRLVTSAHAYYNCCHGYYIRQFGVV